MNDLNANFLWAARRGYLHEIRHFLDSGVNINVENIFGYTALMIVVKVGDLKTARFLVDRGIDINAQDRDGATALGHTCSNGYLHIAKFLVEKGANVNIRNNCGLTVFFMPTPHYLQVNKYLLSLKGPLSLQHIVLNLIEKEGTPREGLPDILFVR